MRLPFLALSVSCLALNACSPAPDAETPATDAHAGMDHSAHGEMDHYVAETTALDPLPDDGVMPQVVLETAWMRPHPGGRDVTAAYFTASLAQGAVDRLTAARIDGAERVELHGHSMDDAGMMRMFETGPQDVTAAEALVFAPGGLHLMVFGLDTVVEGDVVSGVLVFERAGEVAVEFPVQSSAP